MHVTTLISPSGGCGCTSKLSSLTHHFYCWFYCEFYFLFLSFYHIFHVRQNIVNNDLIMCGYEIKQLSNQIILVVHLFVGEIGL